ncbi:MAG: AMP-binding protein, partial [Paracoccus sp. (in: a-proteobacteria)]
MTTIPPLTTDNFEERASWARAHTAIDWLPHDTLREDRADGTIILRAARKMGKVAPNTGHWLHQWAEAAPDRVALSERADPASGCGPWREITYRELLAQVRAVGSALLARGLGAEDAIAVLSGNGVDHLILSLAAQYVGVPIVPLAEQYALIEEAHGRLIFVLDKVCPKLAFVDDAGRYAAALRLSQLGGVEI